MVFSSIAFLFLFLPTLNISYLLGLRKIKLQNFILMLFSLSFYYWGEKDHILIMLGCILVNYACALLIEQTPKIKLRKAYLTLSIVISLMLLAYFKYFNFFLNTVYTVAGLNITSFAKIALPLGISFYTFHALSYVIDVYWKKVPAESNLITFICYVSFFPQLVAGPIVRYSDIRHSFYRRYITSAGVRNGILRFCFGLAKKVLIANEVAKLADYVFYLPHNELSFGVAWLGAMAYTLQIYFDFSGYSDMAIGLGLMFGFRYKENFRFPYNALSVQEFWRKWHISLSSWFRDYIYIPLGGSHGSLFRTQLNLIIIFGLCGLWHGASYTFILWGLYHGAFLILERSPWGRILNSLPLIVRHSYVLSAVIIGWVFFREDNLDSALTYIKTMLIPSASDFSILGSALNIISLSALFLGAILSIGLSEKLMNYIKFSRNRNYINYFRHLSAVMAILLFLLSVLSLSTNSYNPFLYFRF